MIVKDFDDMRIGTTPLSKLYYGHDLIWKREDENILIITTVEIDVFTIPVINTLSVTGTIDWGDGQTDEYNSNISITHNYPDLKSWTIKINAPIEQLGGFKKNPYIQTVIIPNSVTNISSDAFEYCASLTSVTIPNSVTSIGKGTFFCCSSLTSITIPDSVTSIGNYAFYKCTSLTFAIIPDSVTSIEDEAFRNCSSLTSITIPDSVTSIEDGVFNDCSSLTSVTIPNSVKSIGKWAFQNTKLTSVTIPNSVTSIGDYAFQYTGLTSVTIAEDCTYGSNSFPSGCVINRY